MMVARFHNPDGQTQLANSHMQCAFKHWFKVLRSNNLGLKEKIDGLLLLNVYFMPVFVLLSWIVGVPLFFLRPLPWFGLFWAFAPISLYSFVGNFAPFFEVGIGAYLRKKKKEIVWCVGRAFSISSLSFLADPVLSSSAKQTNV